MKRQFPFYARVNGQLVKVTGLHWSGAYYESEGAGLLPLHITPVEASTETPRFAAESTVVESTLMYPHRTPDGEWTTTPPQRATTQGTVIEPPRPKQWRKTGFFKGGPHAAYNAAKVRNSATHFYREWLQATLREPMPATEIYRRAAAAQIPVIGLKRAKKFCGVKAVKMGGRYRGWGAQWVWFPVSKLQEYR